MKTKIRLVILMILILLSNYTLSIGQIQQIDSVNVSVEKEEFKHIIKVNIEKSFLDSVTKDNTKIIKSLEEAVDNREQKIKSKDKEISDRNSLYEEQIKEATPAWWDRWYIGGIVFFILARLL